VLNLFFFCLGACLGSFFNVCIYRLPAGKSVISPRSQCACGSPIAWFDNLPVISWFILGGKARCCDLTFSVRYPLVEAVTGVLFLLSWWLFGVDNPTYALGVMLLCSFLIPAIFIDLDHMIIPDIFSIGGALAGVAFSCIFPALHGIEGQALVAGIFGGVEGVIGLLVGSATIYWIGILGEILFRKEAMGEGDVKFLGCIGAFCGWQGALFSIFGGAFLGCIILLPLLLLGKLRKPKSITGSNGESGNPSSPRFGMHIPFGPLLAAGALLYVFAFQARVDAYFTNLWSALQEFVTY